MEDALLHCSGPSCVDEIAQPLNNFKESQIRTARQGGRAYCHRCAFAQTHERQKYAPPTLFELEVERLGLVGRESVWPASQELRRWVVQHANTHFVPESLLHRWRIRVRTEFDEHGAVYWHRIATGPSAHCAAE
jgi:hypothetical protein